MWWLSPANMPLSSLKVIEFWSECLSLFGSVILSVSFKELSVLPGVRSHQHDGHTAGGVEQMHHIRCLNRQQKDMLEWQMRRIACVFPTVFFFFVLTHIRHSFDISTKWRIVSWLTLIILNYYFMLLNFLNHYHKWISWHINICKK